MSPVLIMWCVLRPRELLNCTAGGRSKDLYPSNAREHREASVDSEARLILLGDVEGMLIGPVRGPVLLIVPELCPEWHSAILHAQQCHALAG